MTMKHQVAIHAGAHNGSVIWRTYAAASPEHANLSSSQLGWMVRRRCNC